MRPGITLAMIVKDEAEKLGRCLASAASAVDEIVVVDTGSADRSVEIAQSFGARTRHIEWPGAFDAARNASLEMVETEWAFWLDADEWLAEGAAEAIRQAVGDPFAAGFLLVRRDIVEGDAYSEQLLHRLWRHHPSLRFEGAIHEHLDLDALCALHEGQSIKSTNIPFWHDGYSPHLTRAKAERNLPLLKKEIAEGPKSLYYEIELAQTLKALGDPEWRAVEARLVGKVLALRDLDEPPDDTLALFLMRFLADLNDDGLGSQDVETVLRLSRGWFSNHPGVRYLCAQTEIRRGDLRAALNDLLAVEAMAESGIYDRLTTTPPVVFGEGLSTNLALVAHQLGRRELARKHYRRLLELAPGHLLATQNIARL